MLFFFLSNLPEVEKDASKLPEQPDLKFNFKGEWDAKTNLFSFESIGIAD